MLYVAIRETGTFIEEVDTIQDGEEVIRVFETADLKEGVYTPNSYDIVDENHRSVII